MWGLSPGWNATSSDAAGFRPGRGWHRLPAVLAALAGRVRQGEPRRRGCHRQVHTELRRSSAANRIIRLEGDADAANREDRPGMDHRLGLADAHRVPAAE